MFKVMFIALGLAAVPIFVAQVAAQETTASSNTSVDGNPASANETVDIIGDSPLSAELPATAAAESSFDVATRGALAGLREERPAITKAIHAWRDAPETASYFVKDKNDYRKDLDGLLDDALGSLGLDDGRKTRNVVRQVDKKISELDMKLADLEMERAAGALPRQADLSTISSYNPLTRTVEKLGSEIEEVRLQQQSARDSRSDLIDGFRQKVSDIYGQDLDERQAEALIYQANGLDLIESAETVKVLTSIEARLADGIAADAESNAALRGQYYEISVITRLLIQRLNEQHLANYDTVYFPALEGLQEQQTKVRRASERTAAAVATDNQKRVMTQNLTVQGDLGDALRAYRGILEAGKAKTEKMLDRSRQEAEVAISTLATYNLATDLSDLGARHFQELSSLAELSAPELMPLNDEQLFQQMVEVSRQLPGV